MKFSKHLSCRRKERLLPQTGRTLSNANCQLVFDSIPVSFVLEWINLAHILPHCSLQTGSQLGRPIWQIWQGKFAVELHVARAMIA
jgi:hypothetical protein